MVLLWSGLVILWCWHLMLLWFNLSWHVSNLSLIDCKRWLKLLGFVNFLFSGLLGLSWVHCYVFVKELKSLSLWRYEDEFSHPIENSFKPVSTITEIIYSSKKLVLFHSSNGINEKDRLQVFRDFNANLNLVWNQ